MNKRRLMYIAVVAVSIGIVFTVLRRQSVSEMQSNQLGNTGGTVNTAQSPEASQRTKSEIQISNQNQVGSSGENSESRASNGPERAISLSSGNFEGFVNECFKGESCIFSEDPISMYKFFKESANHKANDSLISFLRSKMKDEQYRKRYNDALKKMIEDFYPPEEMQFQEAAYYNYLGDLQKSLDLYLDLERKSQSDASLRPAPKLNIANTLYDLQRYKDSLPYYQAALGEYVSREQEVTIPNQNDMIRFIEERIEDVKKRF